MDIITQVFRQKVSAVWGDKGTEWLAQLPDLIETCSQRWGLTLTAPLTDLAHNFVALAETSDGRDVVLKISVPDKEAHAEMDALRLHHGRNVAALLYADADNYAIVIERVMPGVPLSEMADDDAATEIGAQMIRDFPVPVPENHRFPTLERWALAFARLRDRFDGGTGPLPAHLVDKVEQRFKDLQASSPSQMLLHGDLHHFNILSSDAYGWCVIDPKGVIGDPGYETARFQLNPWDILTTRDQPQKLAARRAEIMASILNMDQTRILSWAFFDAMLGACWSVEGWGDPTYVIISAEIFDSLID